MTPDKARLLSARYRAECEADIRYALAEGLDPLREYLALVTQLRRSAALNDSTSAPQQQALRVDNPEIDSILAPKLMCWGKPPETLSTRLPSGNTYDPIDELSEVVAPR